MVDIIDLTNLGADDIKMIAAPVQQQTTPIQCIPCI